MILILPLIILIICKIIYNNNKHIGDYILIILPIYIILYNSESNFYIDAILLLNILICSIWYFLFLNVKKSEENVFILYILTIIILMSNILIILSSNLISLFLTFELTSLSILVIISLFSKDRYISIIYFLISSILTIFFIISLIYLNINYNFSYKILYWVILFKLGLPPIFLFIMKLYNNLPLGIVAFLDIPYKLICFIILSKINSISDTPYIIWIIIISYLIINSFFQTNLIEILILSSLVNYIIILNILNFNNNTIFWHYLFIYFLTQLLFIFFIKNKNMTNNHFILLLLYNFIGIPPFEGFFIKFFFLKEIAKLENYFNFIIPILFLFLLLSYLYTKLINNLYNFKELNYIFSYQYLVFILLIIDITPLWY